MHKVIIALKIGGLSFLFSILVLAYYAYSEFGYDREVPTPLITLLPAGYPQSKPTSAYTGPHPYFTSRQPQDFQFPVKLGQIGPTDTLLAGERQYPFLCQTEAAKLGQPLIDNQNKVGMPVYALDENGVKTESILGYSKDCLLTTRADYYYQRIGSERFYPLEDANNDIAQIVVAGNTIDFIVRFERGTINRFIYGLAVLATANDALARPNNKLWNGKLIYQFRGGVGIGKRQGKLKPKDVLDRRSEQLALGYGVVYSTGNQTSNHYNIWLAESTAILVKKQFTALYGKPVYTVGIGSSGGGIQQYLLAQNHPGLLDGLIPLYSYPDMVTQVIYAFDCELLEHYFEVTDADNPLWDNFDNRIAVQGLNSDGQRRNKFIELEALARVFSGQWPNWRRGLSECENGWRGLTPLVLNPNFVHYADLMSKQVHAQTQWTHWHDLKHYYGIDQYGYARSPWDNVGVQYGLAALQKKRINIEDFIRLNALIGGWKHAKDMRQERFWHFGGDPEPNKFSLRSAHNMTEVTTLRIPRFEGTEILELEYAPRTQGNLDAIAAAYHSGHIYLGLGQLPIIDLRHYLDDELDMHHSFASLASRARIQQQQGSSQHHLIWVAEKGYDPTPLAFEVMDQWLITPDQQPVLANDRCFNNNGDVIAAGSGVWDGAWNQRPSGTCQQHFPNYQSSRNVAGMPMQGDIFKCQLQSLDQAIAKGLYGDTGIQQHLDILQAIFPQGVCDYSLPDAGKPIELQQINRLRLVKH